MGLHSTMLDRRAAASAAALLQLRDRPTTGQTVRQTDTRQMHTLSAIDAVSVIRSTAIRYRSLCRFLLTFTVLHPGLYDFMLVFY